MTLFKVSAADEYTVRSVQKTVQDKRGLYPTGAHYPDHPYIRRILHPAHTGRVSSSVRAPMAEEAQYPWFVFHTFNPCCFMKRSPLISPLLYKEGLGEVMIKIIITATPLNPCLPVGRSPCKGETFKILSPPTLRTPQFAR